jgi:Family of unknown function (DUF6152)
MPMLVRRHFIVGSAAMALAGGTLFGTRGYAHHGWDWADESENFELTGVIKSAQLGNPHGLLTVTAKNEDWTVEVGQPWRNERAGLKDAMLAKGVEATFQGHRAKDKKKRLMKAERIIIAGRLYNLYPDRD